MFDNAPVDFAGSAAFVKPDCGEYPPDPARRILVQHGNLGPLPSSDHAFLSRQLCDPRQWREPRRLPLDQSRAASGKCSAGLRFGIRFSRTRSAAFAMAAIWGVHPLLTESVTNIVGRADLLAGFGVLAGCCVTPRARGPRLAKAAWIAGLSAAASSRAFFKGERRRSARPHAALRSGLAQPRDVAHARRRICRGCHTVRRVSYICGVPCILACWSRLAIIPWLGAGF